MGIEERLRYLDSLVSTSKYEKQKRTLESNFLSFLGKSGKYNLRDSTPEDVRRFLVSKDKGGKTIIHSLYCKNMGTQEKNCSCPRRLAIGTVKSLLGKLLVIFEGCGKRGPWQGIGPFDRGNPVDSEEVRQYVKAIQKEQSLAHVEVKQAIPMFIDKLTKISHHILSVLNSSGLKSADIFIGLRDRAFFLLQYFAGDRAGDLGRVVAQEVKRLPNNEGLLFKHRVGKTLSNGKANVFATVPITLTVHPLKRKNVRRKENTRETNKPQNSIQKSKTKLQDEIFILVILAFPSCNSSSLLLRLFSLSLFRF